MIPAPDNPVAQTYAELVTKIRNAAVHFDLIEGSNDVSALEIKGFSAVKIGELVFRGPLDDALPNIRAVVAIAFLLDKQAAPYSGSLLSSAVTMDQLANESSSGLLEFSGRVPDDPRDSFFTISEALRQKGWEMRDFSWNPVNSTSNLSFYDYEGFMELVSEWKPKLKDAGYL